MSDITDAAANGPGCDQPHFGTRPRPRATHRILRENGAYLLVCDSCATELSSFGRVLPYRP
ncbi:hypothetical protein [Phytomonospora endophytica]|uniref:Uncharacterized protein n=1 Tax=Phytomonospora endophytica TaxID=714109 RepID=A0A841FBE3_9ACTN|nr:hypothetical protein [Phytomonospora endophytica]MBB6034591.1 hypothetical protein [Phytomonospora endophytica]GIG71349.1 hypothetical protein Pen01_76440 [Phytomonospora endophytica]